jgi:dihydrofolate synthase/folylpolyglutamate synthase
MTISEGPFTRYFQKDEHMTYKETLDYLNAQLPMYHRIGTAAYRADLNNTWAICNLRKNPQEAFRSVHIGGTNGKGSTSNMLASILQEKGLKTGLYTSPHLTDFRERIRINGIKIPEEKVVHFVENYKQDFEKIRPSFFEMTVGMAFDYFREEKIDVAIIEVGLGGRLDSTNVLTPLLSVITNISFDHMQFLGDTVEKIAMEKAGIIKHGVPVVIGESQDDIRHVFIEKAKEEQSEILFADAEFMVKSGRIEYNPDAIFRMDILKNNKLFLANLESPLLGNYQKKNIVSVCEACKMLDINLIHISSEDIRNGISHVIDNNGFAGRWQILSKAPLTICDTGHNEGGLREVLGQINKTPHEKLHFVFGMVDDKEIDTILQMLPKDAVYYFCKADIPRGMDANELRIKAQGFGLQGDAFESVNSALKAAQQMAEMNDLVFIGGSTFIVAEVV